MIDPTSGAKQTKLTAEERECHLAEYNALRAEILDHSGALITTAQYTIAASAGLYFFLLTLNSKILASLKAGGSLWLLAFLPTLLLIFGLFINLQKHSQIDLIGSYITELETKLGDRKLGWEHYYRYKERRSVRSQLSFINPVGLWFTIWTLMILASLTAGFGVYEALLASAQSSPSPVSATHQLSTPTSPHG